MKQIKEILLTLLILVGLSALVFFLADLFITKSDQIFPHVSDEDITTTRNNCRNLVVPDSFVKIDKSESIKYESVFIGTQYFSEADPKLIEDYFVKQLTRQEWMYAPGNDGPTRYLRFYKGKFEIELEYLDVRFPTPNKKYYIYCIR